MARDNVKLTKKSNIKIAKITVPCEKTVSIGINASQLYLLLIAHFCLGLRRDFEGTIRRAVPDNSQLSSCLFCIPT